MSVLGVTQLGNTKPTRVAQSQQVKRALARAAFTICWLPTVIVAMSYWAQGKTHAPLILLALIALWYLVEYKVPRRYSNYLSILIAMVILYAPAWEPNPSARLWYAITVAGAATVILSSLYAPWPGSLLFVILTALIEHFVLVSQTSFLFSPGAHGLNDWIGPLWLVLLGFFVAFASHRINETMLEEDRHAESLETLNARDAISRALSEEHASQQRRLHETVLNTLATLVRKDGGSTTPLLTRLRDEISQARVYQGLETPTSMSSIVGSVIPHANENDPEIEIVEGDDVVLAPPVARDVRDALAELVRNAIKHSRGSRILISWEVSAMNLLIKVADDGVGLSEKARKGLGLGRIMPEILRDRDATMTVSTNDGTGTRVSLNVPLHLARDEPVVSESPYSILEEFDSVGRLLLAAPALSVAALGWWLIGPFEPKPILAGLLFLHVASLLTASLNPRARGAWILIAFGLMLGLSIIFIISINSKACTNTGQLRWAANFLYSSTSVGLVFYAPSRLRPIFILATTSGLFLLSLPLPTACASALLSPAIALLGVFLVVFTLWRQSTHWRASVRLGERRSAEMTRRRIERRLSIYRADQWSTALDNLDRFARTAAVGTLPDGEVQRQAHLEEERLRARIQLDPFVNGAFAQMALDLVNRAAERGWTPTITVVETHMNSQAIPVRVHRALSESCSEIQNGACQITLYLDDDEECLTIVAASLDVERAANEINLGEMATERSLGSKPIRAIFDSSDGERWLEIRRRL